GGLPFRRSRFACIRSRRRLEARVLPALPSLLARVIESPPRFRKGLARLAAAVPLTFDDPPCGEGCSGAAETLGEIRDRRLGDDRVLLFVEHVLEHLRSIDESLRPAARRDGREFGGVARVCRGS